MLNKFTIVAPKAIVAGICMFAFACGDDSPTTSSNNQSDTGWDLGDRQDSGADTGTLPDSGEADVGVDAEVDADEVDVGGDTGVDLCLNVDCSAMDDACGHGVCDPATGACVAEALADGTPCDDGDLCSVGDMCAAGVCEGAAMDCSGSADACNNGVCDPTTGACVAEALNDGTPCDDGDLCSVGDACAAGVCEGAAMDCSGSADSCNNGVCDPTTGACTSEALNDGTPCDDGDLCSVGDACAAGVCEGAAMDCSGSADACNNGVCDPMMGACTSEALNDGTPCDDGDLCTLSDACSAGVCQGAVMDCSGVTDQCNAGQCTAGMCAPDPVMDGSTCDADNICSWADSCQAGACAVGTVGDCNVRDIEVSVGQNTPLQGGPGGGNFMDTCPLGQVVIGVEGRISDGFYNDILYQLATICGDISVANGVVTTTQADRLPATGGRGGGASGPAPVTALCPADHVAVGFTGTTGGAFVTQITLSCAPLSVTGTASTGYSLELGAAADTATLGTRVGAPMMASACPAGSIARGMIGRAGDVLDSVGMTCGAAKMDILTTAPLLGSASGGTSTDDCPVGQVPIGLTAAVSTAFYAGILTEYSMQCGTLNVAPTGAGFTTTISAGDRIPATGHYGNWTFKQSAQTVSCPADHAFVGLSGTGDNSGTRRLTPSCAPVIVTGDAIGGLVVSYGTPTDTATLGTSTALQSGPYYCPEGTLASGFLVRSGEILDGISLRCAPPTLIP